LKLTNRDKQIINNKLTTNKWDKTFKQYDDEKKMATVNKKLLENQKKYKIYLQKINNLKSKANDIRNKREKLRGPISAHYTTRTIQQRLEKGTTQYTITRDTMKKILSDEITDFNKFYNSNQ